MLYNNINSTLNTQRGMQNLTDRGMENNLDNIKDGFTNELAQTSTNIFIKSNDITVGMIQSFSISESRTINKLQTIGVEGVAQAVPANTNGGQIQTTRIALYGSRLLSGFGLELPDGVSAFKTLKEQRYPFEIQVLTRRTSNIDSGNQFWVDTYMDCWISNFQRSYTVQNITVSEQATITYSDVV